MPVPEGRLLLPLLLPLELELSLIGRVEGRVASGPFVLPEGLLLSVGRVDVPLLLLFPGRDVELFEFDGGRELPF